MRNVHDTPRQKSRVYNIKYEDPSEILFQQVRQLSNASSDELFHFQSLPNSAQHLTTMGITGLAGVLGECRAFANDCTSRFVEKMHTASQS